MKKEIKFSKFSHFYYKNNNVCAYNALTMDTVYFEKKYKDKLFFAVNNVEEIHSLDPEVEKIMETLKEKDIIVDDCYNEKDILNSIKPKIFNNVNIRVMVLHLTDFCNLKCKYCFIEGGMCENYVRKNMSKEVMRAAIDKYIQVLDRSEIKEKPSIVFYGGEPLANWEVIKYGLEYIDDCRKNGKLRYDIDKVIITNGTLITDEIAKCLKQYDVLVSLSLDGTKLVHDYNRIDYDNKGSFDRVMHGFNILREVGLEPAVSCVMRPFAIKHAEENIKFLLGDLKIKGLGFNHVSIIPKLNYYDPEYEEKFAETMIKVQEIIQEKYDDVYERRMGHKINCFLEKKIITSRLYRLW